MIITGDCSVASAHRQESPARINPLAYSNETLPASAGAPRSNHSNRGEPATNAAATTSVASAATSAGQAIQAPAIATQCSSSSIRTRTGPGVGTTTCRLSSLVEKTAGRPMSRRAAGGQSQNVNSVTAHGPAIQARISTENLRPEDTRVSYG